MPSGTVDRRLRFVSFCGSGAKVTLSRCFSRGAVEGLSMPPGVVVAVVGDGASDDSADDEVVEEEDEVQDEDEDNE